jgi:hypothetical protein
LACKCPYNYYYYAMSVYNEVEACTRYWTSRNWTDMCSVQFSSVQYNFVFVYSWSAEHGISRGLCWIVRSRSPMQGGTAVPNGQTKATQWPGLYRQRNNDRDFRTWTRPMFCLWRVPTGQDNNFVYIQKFIGQLGASNGRSERFTKGSVLPASSLFYHFLFAFPPYFFCYIGKDVATPTEF